MAAWDAKDPRWIVAERPDGANVNSWHWEEKNCLPWFRAQAESQLSGLSADGGPAGSWTRITALKELKGEASLCTRKGNKKVAVFDLTVTLSWEGFDSVLESTCKGELKLSEFASANEEEDFVCAVTVEGKGEAHEALKKRAASLRPRVVTLLLALAADLVNQ